MASSLLLRRSMMAQKQAVAEARSRVLWDSAWAVALVSVPMGMSQL